MIKLGKFLYRNLKGYRMLVLLAVFITICGGFRCDRHSLSLKIYYEQSTKSWERPNMHSPIP